MDNVWWYSAGCDGHRVLAVRILHECILVCYQIWISTAYSILITRQKWSCNVNASEQAWLHKYLDILPVCVLRESWLGVVCRHLDRYVDCDLVGADQWVVKRLRYCELAIYIIMYDKIWNSCHDDRLLIATCIWRVLEAVSTLGLVWIANSVRDITHCLKFNHAGYRTGRNSECKV